MLRLRLLATFAQRGKEEASDYRYFPDPDLTPVTVSDEFFAEVKAELCELPATRRRRYRADLGLSHYDADVIVSQGDHFTAYFEQVAKLCGDGKQAANWLTQDVQRELNRRSLGIDFFPIPSMVLGDLLKRVTANQLTVKSAREVFDALLAEHDAATERHEAVELDTALAEKIIADRGLAIVNDTGAIKAIIAGVIARNPKPVADFKSGKQAAVGSLIGQIMKELKGADAKVVRQMLIDELNKP